MKIELLDSRGIPFNLVRFFQVDGLQLLIYTVNDLVDEQGHVTIHISVIGTDGQITAYAVADEQWDFVKGLIKNIVSANKNNQPLPIMDLDYNALNGINLVGDKALKLMSNYVELLKANQPIFNQSEAIPAEENFGEQGMNQDVQQNVQPSYQPVYDEETVQPVYNEETVQPVYNETEYQQNPEQPAFDNFQPQYENPEQPAFDNFQPQYENPEQPAENQDFQSLYYEQVEINNQLNEQLAAYENKLAELRNIINN